MAEEGEAPCKYCVVGALDSVGDYPMFAAEVLAKEIPSYPGDEDFSAHPRARLIRYNDYPTTTKEDVLALIDRALEKLK